MASEPPTKTHVFADQDAAVIYQGLMLIVSAISDLKEIILAKYDDHPNLDGA